MMSLWFFSRPQVLISARSSAFCDVSSRQNGVSPKKTVTLCVQGRGGERLTDAYQ
ncbi:hypothetical protein C4J93_0342 [Pseudomonas sp. R2-37-08W]|nr:hypothetical protein C4J93_0342 [Pseudomonas sp. R2-37-08W]